MSRAAALLVTLWAVLPLTGRAGPVIGVPAPDTHSVGLYQRFEVRVPVTGTVYTNAYDFDPALGGAVLQAAFTSASGTATTVDGFYADGYTLTVTNTGTLAAVPAQNGWRVRFSPTEVGIYRYSLTFKDSGGTSLAATGSFTAIASEDPGFIRRQAGKNYLRFDSNAPYIPVGENLCWAVSGLGEFKTYLDKLALNRANMIRVWLCNWGIELEWQNGSGPGYAGLKRYAQNHAYELDWLLEYCATRGIYLEICINYHGQFVADSEWAANPYNSLNGGPCTTSGAFFSNAAAKAVYKNKLRYLVARYGYSKNVMAWELFNEMNLIDNYDANQAITASWCGEMAAYLKSVDANRHLVSNSYTMGNGDAVVWNNDAIDFTQTHTYDRRPDLEKPMAEACAALLAAHGKPFLSGEFGIRYENDLTAVDDPNGTSFRNTLWASAFNGSMGAGMSWWWDEWIHPLNDKAYPVILHLRDFLDANANVVANNYLPVSPEVRTLVGQTLTLTPGYSGFQPPLYAATKAPYNAYTVNVDGALAPAESTLGKHLFGAWKAAQRNPPTFTFTMPTGGLFKVKVANNSAPSTLSITLDGTNVLTQVNPVANGVYAINVAAGAHAIMLDNTGSDWIQIATIEITNFQPGITGSALRDGERMVGYLRLRDYNWEYLLASGQVAPPAVTGGTLTVRSLLPRGIYAVSYTSVDSGGSLGTTNVAASDTGVLTAALPALVRDLAFVVDVARTATGTPYSWLQHFSVNADTGDEDDDGMLTWQEYLADTDPTNAASCLRITALSNLSPRRVYFTGSSTGRYYTLRWTTNLAVDGWIRDPGQPAVVGDGGVDFLTDSNALPGLRFYRIDAGLP